jgi:3-dehydroquinate dehydratase
MLQNLSEEIRECLRHAEECKRLSKIALTPSAIKDYLDMEQRWLNLARSYEFTERLSRYIGPARKGRQQKE